MEMDHSYVHVYLDTLEMDDFAMVRITSSILWLTFTNSAADILKELLAKCSSELWHYFEIATGNVDKN